MLEQSLKCQQIRKQIYKLSDKMDPLANKTERRQRG